MPEKRWKNSIKGFKMRYFIDSNIFIRTLHKENEKSFLECVSLLKSIKKNRIDACTGTVVLAEIAWTLRSFYQIEKTIISAGLRSILNINGIRIIDNYNHNTALDIYEKYSIKYIDALIASIDDVFSKKMTIVSYDRDFDKLKVLRKEPGEIFAEYK
jgi:predicted nucleic acid-binding protein